MPVNEYPDIERRLHKRQVARFTLRYKIAGEEKKSTYTATTSDISVKSFSFDARQLIPIGTKIDAELVLAHLSEPLKIKGTIKRVEESEQGDVYFYAVVFEDISEKDHMILEQYIQTLDVNRILRTAIRKHASDIHLISGSPPILRVEGELVRMEGPEISGNELKEMVLSILTEKQKAIFKKALELDFSYIISEGMRFKGNLHLEKGNLNVSFRVIPAEVKSVSELNLPTAIEELAKRKMGLILITGPAGSGKSTTLTTLIDLINKERRCMIISIEDPIEYVHKSKKSIIKQREVGTDTLSYSQVLKHVLRQDPNVILVGEMRDLDSISIVMTAAETGHLILSTLHTPDTVECINRIIDVYPADQQNQIRSQLAGCLEGIIAQLLLPQKKEEGMIVATEVLVATPAVRNLIRTGQISQIHMCIETGSQLGMHTMDDSLLNLVRSGLVAKEAAVGFARDPKKFQNI